MKKLGLIVWMLVNVAFLYAQYDKEMEYQGHYAIGLMQLNSGSGYGAGISLIVNIQKGRKNIGFGPIIQQKNMKLSGVSLKYRIFTGRFDDVEYMSKRLKPYFEYDLLYRHASVDKPMIVLVNNAPVEIPEETGSIGTMEHYLSFGSQFKAYKKIYLDASVGAGIYIGSLDQINQPKTIGIHYKNHGFTGFIRIGIGYRIN